MQFLLEYKTSNNYCTLHFCYQYKKMLGVTVLLLAVAGAQSMPSLHSVNRGAARFLKQGQNGGSFDGLKPAKTSYGATPSGYWVVHQFQNDQKCGSSQSMVLGTGTGMCFEASVNGTSVGSIVYNLGTVSANAFTINSAFFKSTDCTGDPTYNTMTLPTSCVPSDEDSNGYIFTYTTDPAPWTSYGTGIVFQ